MSAPISLLDCASVPAAFSAAARAHADKIALRDGGARLTYAELDRRANRLAHALLQARGSEPEPVALHLPHGAAAIVAMLAILKAGKYYVVLDPAVPARRNQAILRGSAAAAGLTDSAHLALARELGDIGWLTPETRLLPFRCPPMRCST